MGSWLSIARVAERPRLLAPELHDYLTREDEHGVLVCDAATYVSRD
jgi:hypothetical protein